MTIKARLARLEARAPGREKVYGFADDGITHDEAVARQFQDAPPKHVEVIILCWADDPA